MKSVMILLAVALAPAVPAWAGHGSTEALIARTEALREKWKDTVPYESLEVRWCGEALYYQREDGAGWWKVSLESGEKSGLAELPGGTVPGPGGKGNGKGKSRPSRPAGKAVSPDGKWRVEIEESRWVSMKGEDAEAQRVEIPLPEGWVVDERVLWSPRSDRFLVWRRPNHDLRRIHYVRSSPENRVQPERFSREYPKAGDALNVARPVICFVDGSDPMLLEEALIEHPFRISNHRWREDGVRLSFEFIERGFGRYAVIEMDSAERSQRVVVEERSETFLHVFDKCFRHDLKGGAEVLWLSERDGWNHLYLLDGKSGQAKAQLTRGEWTVRGVEEVREEEGEALIHLGGYHEGQDPYWIHWARLGLGGGELEQGELVLLTSGAGTHQVRFSPDRRHYVAEWSRVDAPPVHELRRASDGGLVALLERAEASALLAAGWTLPERFVCKDRNDKFDIHGIILRPPGFDPALKYPVVEKIYAGPHGAFVPKRWRKWFGGASELAAAGFIVVQIDGLGTSHRCREFHEVAYKNLMDSGLPDRVKWIRAAGAKYPELDVTRVGIYGGSAGGQNALAALLHHGDFYRAAAADCGCHDNRLDKIWWNEQWMDWPVGPHYVENANVSHIEKLQGHLLLTVGEVDTNVDPASTLQVVDALIKADKDFEFYLVPNGGHGIGESPYLRRKRIEFFQRHLGEPRERVRPEAGNGKS